MSGYVSYDPRRGRTNPTNAGRNWRDRLRTARMAVQAFLRLDPASGSSEPVIASSERQIPSRSPLSGQALARFRLVASAIVDSDPVIRTYAACEWEDLHEDGKDWVAGIVAEAMRRAEPILAAELDRRGYVEIGQGVGPTLRINENGIELLGNLVVKGTLRARAWADDVDEALVDHLRDHVNRLRTSCETIAKERDEAVEARVSAERRAAELEALVEAGRTYTAESALSAAYVLFDMTDVVAQLPRCLVLVDAVATALGMRRDEA